MATGVGYYKCSPELYAKYLAAGHIVDTDFYFVEDSTLGISKLYLGKILLSNVVPKGDTEENWNKAVGFIPLDKEVIIYKPDENHSMARIKIGDGITSVQELPFVGNINLNEIQTLIDENLKSKVSIANAIAGLYTIYGKRKLATEDELYQEFEDGSECVFRGGYYPNDLKDFEKGDRRIVMYGKKGTFSVDMAEDRGDAPEDKHVANRQFVLGKDAEVKQFVQDNYVKLDKPTEVGRSYIYRSYYHGGGKYTNNTVKATPASDQYTIMERDSGGRSSVEAPTSAKHVANKDYVDKAIADTKTTLEQKIKELEERLANL